MSEDILNPIEVLVSYSIDLDEDQSQIIKLSGKNKSIVVEIDFLGGGGQGLVQSSIDSNELLTNILSGEVADTANWRDWDLGAITSASEFDMLASDTPPNALKFINLSGATIRFNYKGAN